MNKENKNEKPFDIICSETYEHMSTELINIIETAKVPLSVSKLILVQVTNNILNSINNEIEKQKDNYYKNSIEE